MPLSMIRTGESSVVKKVGGKGEIRRFLESLGFIPGSIVTVISENNGNLIVNIKEARIAINKEMACKIIV